jgi:hypothetical protein
MDIAGLLDDVKERIRTRGATPLVGGGLVGAFTRGLLGLDPEEDSTETQFRAYQTGQALSNTPTPLALAAAPAAIVKAGKAAKATKPLPREAALETARKNAVEMLGLPESNTAMDRAKAMGFKSEEFYHGTQKAPKGIDQFKSATGYAGQEPTTAVWMAQSPRQAGSYANWIENVGNPTIYPLLVRKNKEAPLDVLEAAAIASREDINPEISLYNQRVQKYLKDRDFKSARFDSGDGDYKVVFDPSLIRSRFAAFDPARINEKDLLASLAALGITVPFTMGLLSDQQE